MSPQPYDQGTRVTIVKSVDPHFNNTIGKKARVVSYKGKLGIFGRPLQHVYFIEIEDTGHLLGALHEELERVDVPIF